MRFEVLTIPPFEKQLKKLCKKYSSLKSEFAELIESLETNPTRGTGLGNNCYKIRISIASKGKGKSGGARVTTHVKIIQRSVYLLSIFDKSELENISDKELKSLLEHIE